jgi:nucleoside-diphosphate-sugar epimerase
MIYIDECIDQTVQYLKAPKQNLKRCVYNMGGISFTPEQLIAEVQKLIPGFTAEYDLCPIRTKIADSWPRKLDDSLAHQDWGMTYDVTIYDLAHKILSGIDEQYKVGKVLNMEGSPITSAKQSTNAKEF